MPLWTLKRLVRKALELTGDEPENLVCFWQEMDWSAIEPTGEIIRCSFDELPENEFDASLGGRGGENFIGFSDRYVYVPVTYDGAYWIEPVPRHPECVEKIERLGGGM